MKVVMKTVSKSFEVKSESLSWCLGLKVEVNRDEVHVSSPAHVKLARQSGNAGEAC